MATKRRKKTTTRRKKTTRASKPRRTSSAGSSKDVLTVDLTDTESRGGAKGGRRPHYEEGDYLAKITKAVRGKSSQKKTPLARVTFKFKEGKVKGKSITDDFYLNETSLWRFRNLLEGAGMKVPSKKIRIPLKKLVGCEVAITLEDDVFEDDSGNERVSSRVVDTFLPSELEDVEEDVDADLDDDEEDEDEYDDEEDEEEEEEEEEEEDFDEDEDEDEDLEDVDVEEL